MKKLLIIILLLITANAFGQAVLSGSKGWDGMYNIRADQFFTRCVTAGVTLTDAQKRWYNDSIFVPLSDSGLIGSTRAGDSLQALWCFATFPNGSANVCVLNLLSDSNTCTAVNSPTFTDSGVVGNGSSSYLNTNFNPVWDSSIYKLNSASLGAYAKSNRTASSNFAVVGNGDGTNNAYILLRRATTNFAGTRINQDKFTPNFGNDTTCKGYTAVSRLSRTILYSIEESYNYTDSTSSEVSTKIPNSKMYILARSTNDLPVAGTYDTAVTTFVFIGSGLSPAKLRAMGNILNNSLKGRGYNVY